MNNLSEEEKIEILEAKLKEAVSELKEVHGLMSGIEGPQYFSKSYLEALRDFIYNLEKA